MINIDLHCLDTEKGNIPIMFALNPISIIGYKACAWSETGERTIIRLLFDSYQEWLIDTDDKTAVQIVSNLAKGIERHSYTFVKLTIK